MFWLFLNKCTIAQCTVWPTCAIRAGTFEELLSLCISETVHNSTYLPTILLINIVCVDGIDAIVWIDARMNFLNLGQLENYFVLFWRRVGDHNLEYIYSPKKADHYVHDSFTQVYTKISFWHLAKHFINNAGCIKFPTSSYSSPSPFFFNLDFLPRNFRPLHLIIFPSA